MNDHNEDPLGVEHEREKLDHEIPKEGPPVSRMATTYGSSFVTSEEEADEIAADQTDQGVGAHAGLGGPGHPGGPTGSPPAEPPATHRRTPSDDG